MFGLIHSARRGPLVGPDSRAPPWLRAVTCHLIPADGADLTYLILPLLFTLRAKNAPSFLMAQRDRSVARTAGRLFD